MWLATKGAKHFTRELKDRAAHMVLEESTDKAAIMDAMEIRDRRLDW